MNKTKILPAIILIILGICGKASAQQEDVLLMYGESSRDFIQIQWQPMNPEHWDSLNTIGYQLERFELTDTGEEIVDSKKVLAGNASNPLMLPKDTIWFQENSGELDGLIEAMGALLYDTTFQFPKNELLDATSMRYNFLLYEAQWKPLAGEALGLLYEDRDVIASKKYRYRVSATLPNGKTLSNSLDFEAGQSNRTRNPEDLFPRYEFPTRLPLSMMISMQTKKRRDRVVAQARAYEDSIVLRWGPNEAEFWLESIETGYYVLRQEVGSDVKGGYDTVAHVMPWAKSELNESITSDEMAMVAANSLHGDNVKDMEGTFIDKARLFESRFGFALYAAERSVLAADVLGLRFVDSGVEEGKTYNYRITCPAANNLLSSARISLTNTYVEQPPPVDFKLISGDQYILLEWDKDENRTRFSSYILERSGDGGKTFIPMTEQPIVFLESEEFPIEIYNFQDSVMVNYVEFIYRLRGNDSFAETSAYAEVRGMAVDLTPPPQPSILFGELNEARDTIHLRWDTPPLPEDFAGYKVLFGPAGDGPFEAITDLLPKEINSYAFIGETLDGRQSHYFKIMSQDTAGNFVNSIEYFVSVPDLIPPEPPARVEGYIEDDGTVHLAWEHSISDDVDGYWVYFANNPSDEFSIIHEGMIQENYYTYKIQEKFLNETIFYVVAAKDRQGNRSLLTDVIEVKRPDKVPPQKPKMEPVQIKDEALLVVWRKSVSQDVEQYLIFKRTFGKTGDWALIDSIAGNADPIYRDTACDLGRYYEYRVQAKDDAGWFSEFPLPVKGKIPFRPEMFMIEEFTASLNKDKNQIELTWDYSPPNIRGWDSPWSFHIYKSTGKSNVDSFKILPSDQFAFTDNEFETDALYRYAVKIKFDNGKSGALSPVKSVLVR